MHVEVSVALNFVISYLYNKLPRRRVDMFGEELEKGLKKKFEGHWYPDKPFKGSGFRSVRVNGEKMDPVISTAAFNCGIALDEVKSYLPEELTLWIDPAEVSYRIGEKGPVKILYSDRKTDEELSESVDCEVQATNRGFNPDAQCFKPIDGLSSTFGSLSLSPGALSPSSPTSSNGWPNSQSASPSGALFNSSQTTNVNCLPKQTPAALTHFTTASFAQTKFGSTKLKTNAKRPTRLSPIEFGNYIRQKTATLQQNDFNSPPRSRSLSPRDPRVEFMMDQQQRMLLSQQKQQQLQQFHQQQLQQQQHQQQLKLHFQQQMQQQQQLQQHQHNQIGYPGDSHQLSSPQFGGNVNYGPLDQMPGISPVQSPVQSPMSSPMHSPMNSIQMSPENHSALMEGLNINTVSYPNQYHHLLVAN